MSKNNLGVAFSKSDDRIMCIFPAQAHWALLWGQLHVDAIHWLYCDGLPGRESHCKAMRLAARISEELSLDWSIDPGHLFSQHDDHTCGTIALLHVGAHGLFGFPSRATVLDFHSWLLHRPALGLLQTDPWVYGSGPTTIDVQAQLAALLATTGVPSALASDRATAAIKKLSAPAIQGALAHANPWQALKALTTKTGNNFQYVLKSELMDFIDSKATAKHGTQIPTQKKRDKKTGKSNAAPPMAPDPSTLQLDPSHFIDDESDQVEQIPLTQVTADSRGLAIATLSDALPYLREQESISTDALHGIADHGRGSQSLEGPGQGDLHQIPGDLLADSGSTADQWLPSSAW